MSQISASSVTAVGAVGGSQSGTVQSTSVGSLSSLGGGGSVASVGSSSSVSRSSQMLSLSTSRSMASSTAAAPDERLAAMILALIQIILGLNDKDKDDDNKLLAGLLGMLALSGGRRSASTQISSLQFSQSSQVVQASTTTNVSAVQATSYGYAAGGTSAGDSGGAATGGNLNVVG